jgi:DHA1 family bicyclomycin/chloramphenicol resistance-like MFS transporter
MTRSRYVSLILILGSLTALTPFSIDMYLPGFPAIAKDLQTSAAKVALSLSGFFVGISAGQLLYGPLLDRFGRKKPLYIGLTVYILASVGCAFSHTIERLIFLRCIQALGSCAATVTSVTMVRDLFPVEDNPKVFSLLMLVLGASPMIAPTIGGYVTAAFGWAAVFIVLAVLSMLIFAACLLWLPNSYQPDQSLSLKPAAIIGNFWSIFREPAFYTYAFTGAIAFTGLFAYVSGSPLIFMDVYGVSQKEFGWIFAFLSIGFIGSSQLNNIFIKYFSSRKIVQTVLACYAVIATVFFIAAEMGWLSLPVLLFFLFLLLSCIGIVNPNTTSLTLAPFENKAGTASSLMGAIQLGLGTLITIFISLFEKPSVTVLAIAMGGSSGIALIVFWIGQRKMMNPADLTVAPDTNS